MSKNFGHSFEEEAPSTEAPKRRKYLGDRVFFRVSVGAAILVAPQMTPLTLAIAGGAILVAWMCRTWE